MLRVIIGAGVAIAIMVGFASLGGTAWLGAHIFWDVKVAYIGAPIGAVFAIGLAFTPIAKFKRIILFGVLTILAFIAARYGQTQFAASFGDDQQAGVFWYFGWVATCVGITAFLASIIVKK
jgi:hypothetical protein